MSFYFFIFMVFIVVVKISISLYKTHIEFKQFEKYLEAKNKLQNERIAKKIAEAIFEEAKTNGKLKELIQNFKNKKNY